ncbi:MAG: L-threonine 3-dehydrogenase [Actinobacteria bacterium]|nr:L-threonine 3-dehydrogenase [Actinomycetota bacterium]
MSKKMKAIRKIRKEKGFCVCDVDIPPLGPHDVLVKIEATSVCGTDVSIHKWNEWSEKRLTLPLTIGHEMAGTVVEVGKLIEHVKEGDYVSAESHVTCGMCFQCRSGQAHMCPETQILGVDRDGVYAEYIAIPEKIVWQNDRNKIPPEIATLQEPFGNAVFAASAQDLAAQSVAVLGCGPIGLFTITLAKASGAAGLFAVDLNKMRLDWASKLGATATFNATGQTFRTIADWAIKSNEGYGLDVVFEMSGAASAITAAFEMARPGGRVILFGIPAEPVRIDVAEKMIFKNLTVLALNGRKIFETWYKVRWLLESGVVDLRPLISHDLPFEKVNEALELLAAGEACKIILRP